MTSTNTYTDQSYVVYHITYSGDKLPSKKDSDITPSNYIGSTSLEQINKGYMGSISSKKYKNIWESELKQNSQLFKLEIISYHDTRSDATWKELQIQKLFNVVKNPLFVNMAYASPNGYFGRDVSGENHPSYNKPKKPHKKRTTPSPLLGRKHTEEQNLAKSIRQRGQIHTEERNNKRSESLKGRKLTPEHIANSAIARTGIKREPMSTTAKEKYKQNFLEKYGVSNPSQLKFFSIIETRKSYSKSWTSKLLPEFKR